MSRVILDAKTATEVKNVAFDFASLLASGESLSTATTTCTVYRGTDISPSAVISGTTSTSGTIATQKVTGGTLGVIYLLLCTVTTSASQTLTLSGLLAIASTST